MCSGMQVGRLLRGGDQSGFLNGGRRGHKRTLARSRGSARTGCVRVWGAARPRVCGAEEGLRPVGLTRRLPSPSTPAVVRGFDQGKSPLLPWRGQERWLWIARGSCQGRALGMLPGQG